MWAQLISTLLGVGLMAAPSLFQYGGKAADNDHIIGPVIATFAMVSMWECTNGVRKWNIPLAAWLLLAPWVLSYTSLYSIIADSLIGFLVLLLSLVKMKTRNSFGGGWTSLGQSDPLHVREARKR